MPFVYEAVVVALVMLTTFYLTHVVTESRITRTPREAVQVRFERRWEARHPGRASDDEWQSRVAYLLSCAWCSSLWVGGGVVAVTALFTNVPVPVLVWLASSGATGLLSAVVGALDARGEQT